MVSLSRKEEERRQREERMVSSAERLFCEKGFDTVSVDEIAREAEFTKRTLYHYFNSKHDLFFAVALRSYRNLAAFCQRGFDTGKTGFDRLSSGLYAYLEYTQSHPGIRYVMSEVGRLRRSTSDSPNLQKWLEFDAQLFSDVADVIKQGMKDGTIRSDLDPMKGTFSIIFLSTGFFRLLAETGEHFADHFDIDVNEFGRDSLELLLDAVRA